MYYQFDSQDYTKIDAKYEKNAHSVVRESNIELIIHNPSLATYIERIAITILNEEHDNLAIVGVNYDDLSKVDYMNVRVFNETGVEIKKYTVKDAYDYTQYDGFSFLTDNRIKLIDASSNSYPYTVEYEYQKTLYGTLNLPSWYPALPDQSVENSTFTIVDNNTGVRTYAVNFDPEKVQSPPLQGNSQTWEYHNKEAIETEPYSPILENIPYMLVSPGKFAISGSSGDANTWNSFGKWYYDLGVETRILPEAAKSEINALINGVESEREIVAILFNYLQEKNRYVSIQLGIGGWKPFTADFVHENSYGDCKALTNYMLAALEYVGIEAHAVLIDAGNELPLIEEFPGNQFNHVVLRVTLKNGEEIWLECTSKYLPPNNLGDGYSKKALLVSKKGGEIVSTPSISHLDNGKKSVYSLVIEDNGTAMIQADWSYSGALVANILHQLLPISNSEKNDWLETVLAVEENSLQKVDFSKVKSTRETAEIEFDVRIKNYANTSSKRMFIPLNKFNKWNLKLEDTKSRKLPVRFNYVFTELDTLHIEVPIGYEIETLPTLGTLKYEFASVDQQVERVNDNNYLYTRSISLTVREVKADNYLKLQSFFDELRRLDDQQLVLVRKDS
jgi:transglutaminase-like putative cysteine protease